MRTIRLFALLVAAQALALAQLDPDTLTITVTRNVGLQPDQVGISISVGAPADTSFDDVLAALQGSGVTATNLTSVGTYLSSPDKPETYWYFALALPFASVKDTVTALGRIKDSSPLDVSFYIVGTNTSQALLSSQPCPYTSLVSYAKTQAQNVAAAAGVNVGQIVGVSDSPGGLGAVLVARVGNFSASLGGLSDFLFGSLSPSTSCTMTVQFKLVH